MAFDLLAPFTGAPQQQATADIQANLAKQQQLGLGLGQTNLQGGLAALQSGQNAGVGAINAGNAAATGYLTPAISGATSALYGGQGAGAGALTGGETGGLAALSSGVGSATDAYNRLLANTGATGPGTSDALSAALGLTPGGTSAFQASPGYQFALDQARKTALAGANAAGMAPGGNTLAALEQLGTNYGNQAYQQYITNLQNKLGLEAQTGTAAASGIGNAALTGGTGAANIYTGTGKSLADLYSGTGTNVAQTILGGGTTLASLAQNAGLAAGNLYGSTGANEANLYGANTGQAYGLIGAGYAPYANAADASAQAQEQGPLNLFNLGINAAKFAANPTGAGQVKVLGG